MKLSEEVIGNAANASIGISNFKPINFRCEMIGSVVKCVK